MADQVLCYKIHVNGIVQGVGFRPYVYRLAAELGLHGWVLNSSYGVFIEIEGLKERLDEFVLNLTKSPPPLALIRECRVEAIRPTGYTDFVIKESENDDSRSVMVSPDIAICGDCKKEVLSLSDRRYGYPFTNCTNCGPRFTIIKDLPYDRKNTTMASFPMCPACQQEYDDPLNRRFHAQPNACPVCGPQAVLVNADGQRVEASVTGLLKEGYIIAVKGLGGFHLAVDAHQEEAVLRLRQRKKRDAKSFAVMAANLDKAKEYASIDSVAEELLTSRSAPIVILAAKPDNGLASHVIHPGLNTLGIMLPYTPLHFLLFDEEIDLLVMTSANISDEPLITENEAALKSLNHVADYFLLHDRDIYNPCDDSVVTVSALGTTHFFRRARGFVPKAIPVNISSAPILAVGSEMKNTFCITRGKEAYLSQHWGDLNHYNNYRNFLDGITRFKQMLNVEPAVIAHDLHPEYQATRWAKSQNEMKLAGVQHHHAHMAAVMAENGLEGEVLGLICDGTGWGTDGAIWGCEIFRGSYTDYTRLGHLKYIPLIGGDLSSKRPYRMAFSYLLAALGEEKAVKEASWLLPDLQGMEQDLILQRFNSPGEKETSSAGRMFDAVGAILGISPVNHYEGQAGIELEARAAKKFCGCYPYDIEKENQIFTMDIRRAWLLILEDLKKGISSAIIARKFHSTVSHMFLEGLLQARAATGLNRVVLSGGVFHNQILLEEVMQNLRQNGFEAYQHQLIPPGDGGISLGQAIIASER